MNAMGIMENPALTDLNQELAFPADVSEWVLKDDLREWVVSAVNGLNWENPELIDGMRRNPEFEPKALLCSVAYAFLTGIFGAEEIVRACSNNAEFKSMRTKLPPRAREISAFRKQNRGIINFVLAQVLNRALKTQFVEGEQISMFPPGLRRMIVENAFERLNIARHMDRSGEA